MYQTEAAYTQQPLCGCVRDSKCVLALRLLFCPLSLGCLEGVEDSYLFCLSSLSFLCQSIQSLHQPTWLMDRESDLNRVYIQVPLQTVFLSLRFNKPRFFRPCVSDFVLSATSDCPWILISFVMCSSSIIIAPISWPRCSDIPCF